MSRGARLGIKVFVALVSTLASLTLAEIASRRFYPVQRAHFVDCQGRNTRIWQDDYELGFTMKPNFCGKLEGSEFQNSVNTNSAGFRDSREFTREKSDSVRIFGLGDSFAFGWGVEQQQTYLSLLQQELKDRTDATVDAFNLGVWGYGTLQEIKVFNLFRDYKPDLVILEFYARNAYIEEWGNDLVDNYRFQQWYNSRAAHKERRPKKTDRYWAYIADAKEFLADHCNLCRLAVLEFSPYLRRNFHPSGNESLRKVAWQITGDALTDFDRELQSMNIKCVLLWVPTPDAIARRDYSVLNTLNSFGFRNIVVVSVLDALAGDSQKYYYSLDNHWRPAGHQVAAQLLSQTILARHLIVKDHIVKDHKVSPNSAAKDSSRPKSVVSLLPTMATGRGSERLRQ